MASSKLHDAEAELFTTPSDLLCPITQDLFHSPVLNSLGMVYERDAIQSYMSERASDPVTNMPLPSLTLTPVFPIKSRAMEYRERTSKLCVQRACSVPDKDQGSMFIDPVRYVRRAAELCSKKDFQVPGLSWECVEYLNDHASNAYDAQGMELFASGLREAGFHQEAANVYMRLLESSDGDREMQTRALRQCLTCWFPQEGRNGDGLHERCLDEDVVPRLTKFVSSHHTFTPAQFVDIMVDAHLPDILVLKLIEHLLAQVEDKNCGARQSDMASCQGQLLLKYTQLMCRQLSQEAVENGHGRRVVNEGTRLGNAFSSGSPSECPIRKTCRFVRSHRRSISRAVFFVASFLRTGDGERARWRNPIITAVKAASVILLVQNH